jgi:hypothetical protein
LAPAAGGDGQNRASAKLNRRIIPLPASSGWTFLRTTSFPFRPDMRLPSEFAMKSGIVDRAAGLRFAGAKNGGKQRLCG